MEILIFLMFVLAWVGIGFFTALIRWKWVEGVERISAGVAARETKAACDELILSGVPADFAKLHYENTKQNVKPAKFFGDSMFYGPVGAIIFLAGWGWHTIMKK